MVKEKIDLIFVVLTYRNVQDLKAFFLSLKNCNASKKVIVVNAYYDKQSSEKFEKLTNEYGADFIEIENKGYSFGNNMGIEYALQHYKFKYLVVSNPDIEIKRFVLEDLRGAENAVIGPEIITCTGKKQNPMFYRKSKIAQKFIYNSYVKNNCFLFFWGRVINWSIRQLGRAIGKVKKIRLLPVYELHGCFVVFSENVLLKVRKPYDENMFLYAEESYLAWRLEKEKIPSFFCRDIEVFHKEDGSASYRSDINDCVRKSNLYVFETYYGFGGR